MDWFAIIGTFCLGIVVMWLVRRFAVQLTGVPQLKWLTALLSALLGGAALGFLGRFTQQKVPWPREFWCYPIGLFVGLLGLAALEDDDDLENEIQRLKNVEKQYNELRNRTDERGNE